MSTTKAYKWISEKKELGFNWCKSHYSNPKLVKIEEI